MLSVYYLFLLLTVTSVTAATAAHIVLLFIMIKFPFVFYSSIITRHCKMRYNDIVKFTVT